MFRALFLIFQPVETWDRAARRSLASTLMFYFLPTILFIGAVEAFGLVKWGRWQSAWVGIKLFTPAQAASAEAFQLCAFGFAVLVSAHFIKMICHTFHTRNTSGQILLLVLNALAPVLMLRIFDVIPTLNLWVPWAIGIALTANILYSGVPRMLQPDQPQAFGIFLMCVLVLAMVTAAERFVTIGFLTGKFRPVSDVVGQIMSHFHSSNHLK